MPRCRRQVTRAASTKARRRIDQGALKAHPKPIGEQRSIAGLIALKQSLLRQQPLPQRLASEWPSPVDMPHCLRKPRPHLDWESVSRPNAMANINLRHVKTPSSFDIFTHKFFDDWFCEPFTGSYFSGSRIFCQRSNKRVTYQRTLMLARPYIDASIAGFLSFNKRGWRFINKRIACFALE